MSNNQHFILKNVEFIRLAASTKNFNMDEKQKTWDCVIRLHDSNDEEHEAVKIELNEQVCFELIK